MGDPHALTPRTNSKKPAGNTSRRDFLKTGAVAVGAGLALHSSAMRAAAFVGGDETIRVGLIGCGGRGTGAAVQTLKADSYTKLVAMGDVFEDHLQNSLKSIQATDVAERVDVPKERQFVGFDAYKQVLDAGVDLVCLATPPHFRPEHFKAAIEAGKHAFVEKPVAVDAPGVRSVLETTKLAKQKNLTVLSGLCWRYETSMQQCIAKLHEGAIGDITCVLTQRFNAGVKHTVRQPGWTDMEYQLRNWYYYTWLSSDFIAEQFVHELDNVAWALKDEAPVRISATGGRQTRTGPEYGHIFDHFAVTYEYADGKKVFAQTRQAPGCSYENSVIAHGTKGACDLRRYAITGENPWSPRLRQTVMHQLEHDAMYAALRKGEIINNGEYMAKSSLLGIAGRMAAYTGKTITWEQAMNSQERLGPTEYDWDKPLPEPPVAIPGVTPFV
jgi:predicted dehydrogenase